MDYPNEIKNRIKRADGQLAGVLRMMDEQKECTDIVTQLTAVRTAVDKAIGLVVSANLERCVRESAISGSADAEKLVHDAMNLVIKSR